MKIVVTGGAGFIGSHLVDTLIDGGHEVLIIDDLSSGNKDYVNSDAQFVEADIVDKEAADTIAQFKPEALFHLAAQKNVRASIDDPVFDANINIIGALNVFEAARKVGVRHILFTSTGGAIYDEHQDVPVTEEGVELPLSPYGISKLAIDNYLRFYNNSRGMHYTSLRLANVYGPRQDPKGEAGVVAIFFEYLSKGESAGIFGTGEATRDYVYVGDVVNALHVVLKDSVSGVFNIGTGVETSVNDLYEAQQRIVGSDVSAEHKPAVPGEMMRSVLSSKKLQKASIWKPETTLKEGLQKTWDWFNKSN